MWWLRDKWHLLGACARARARTNSSANTSANSNPISIAISKWLPWWLSGCMHQRLPNWGIRVCDLCQ